MNRNPPADPAWLEEAIEAGRLASCPDIAWPCNPRCDPCAIRAAVPLIAAGVLREAADDLSLSGADQDTARWLRERAAGES